MIEHKTDDRLPSDTMILAPSGWSLARIVEAVYAGDRRVKIIGTVQ